MYIILATFVMLLLIRKRKNKNNNNIIFLNLIWILETFSNAGFKFCITSAAMIWCARIVWLKWNFWNILLEMGISGIGNAFVYLLFFCYLNTFCYAITDIFCNMLLKRQSIWSTRKPCPGQTVVSIFGVFWLLLSNLWISKIEMILGLVWINSLIDTYRRRK